MTQEIFKPIPGFPGYEASDLGRIRSLKAKGKRGDLLKLQQDRNGYLYVRVYNYGKGLSRAVHTLVMSAFVGPRPEGMDICHNDGNCRNNHLSNLRYDTRQANLLDSAKIGKKGKLTRDQVKQIIELRQNGIPCRKVAGMYGMSIYTIYKIMQGRVYRCYTTDD